VISGCPYARRTGACDADLRQIERRAQQDSHVARDGRVANGATRDFLDVARSLAATTLAAAVSSRCSHSSELSPSEPAAFDIKCHLD
jgi:hypothetical protein